MAFAWTRTSCETPRHRRDQLIFCAGLRDTHFQMIEAVSVTRTLATRFIVRIPQGGSIEESRMRVILRNNNTGVPPPDFVGDNHIGNVSMLEVRDTFVEAGFALMSGDHTLELHVDSRFRLRLHSYRWTRGSPRLYLHSGARSPRSGFADR